MRGFLWSGTLRGELLTCLEVLDHSTAYSHVPPLPSPVRRKKAHQGIDKGILIRISDSELVINMSNLRMRLKLRTAGGPLFLVSLLRSFLKTEFGVRNNEVI